MRGIRDISGRTVPIYILQSGSAPGTLFLFGPEEFGGNGDLEEKLKAVMDLDEDKKYEEGEKVEELSLSVAFSVNFTDMTDCRFTGALGTRLYTYRACRQCMIMNIIHRKYVAPNCFQIIFMYAMLIFF